METFFWQLLPGTSLVLCSNALFVFWSPQNSNYAPLGLCFINSISKCLHFMLNSKEFPWWCFVSIFSNLPVESRTVCRFGPWIAAVSKAATESSPMRSDTRWERICLGARVSAAWKRALYIKQNCRYKFLKLFGDQSVVIIVIFVLSEFGWCHETYIMWTLFLYQMWEWRELLMSRVNGPGEGDWLPLG